MTSIFSLHLFIRWMNPCSFLLLQFYSHHVSISLKCLGPVWMRSIFGVMEK